MRAALTVVALSLATPTVASDFRMGLPVDCTLGDTCYIQQYMDRDPGPGASDYSCGPLSYDGHKGTDFALPTRADMTRGVNVLAVADGYVTALRDGMADGFYSPNRDSKIAGRECGNGVLLTHSDGYETQYCHLKSGSITVKNGDQVTAGQPLGQIGLSGKTEFPHLHISLRRDGVEIDPFDRDMTPDCGSSELTHWHEPVPAYRGGGLLDVGMSDQVPLYADVQAGTAGVDELAPDTRALVVYGFAYGVRKGDMMRLQITGPDGVIVQQDLEFDKTQAQAFRAIGKRRRTQNWPIGTYQSRVELLRGAQQLGSKTARIKVE
ncbi:MAG: M23 family metallopeptidase [Arenibacterium sp.]